MRLRRAPIPADVLVVCSGNLCRSPIMHVVLSAERPDLVVRSAGTRARDGDPWHPLALEALRLRGYDPSAVDGRTRRLRRRDVAGATLILGAAGEHRAAAVGLDPGADARVFTLLQAARLGVPTGTTEAGAIAAALTAALEAERAEYDDDLADPIFGDISDFLACVDAVQPAVRAIFGTATV